MNELIYFLVASRLNSKAELATAVRGPLSRHELHAAVKQFRNWNQLILTREHLEQYLTAVGEHLIALNDGGAE